MINIENKALHDQAPISLSISACFNTPLPMPTSASSAPALLLNKASCSRFSHLASARTSQKTSAAAAAAKSLQSCPTLCDPIDGSPPGSPVPGILQARTLE